MHRDGMSKKWDWLCMWNGWTAGGREYGAPVAHLLAGRFACWVCPDDIVNLCSVPAHFFCLPLDVEALSQCTEESQVLMHPYVVVQGQVVS